MSNSFDSHGIVTEYARTLIRVKAKQIVRRPGFSRSDQEDIEQDLVVHLLCQAERFDPERGSLNTFMLASSTRQWRCWYASAAVPSGILRTIPK